MFTNHMWFRMPCLPHKFLFFTHKSQMFFEKENDALCSWWFTLPLPGRKCILLLSVKQLEAHLWINFSSVCNRIKSYLYLVILLETKITHQKDCLPGRWLVIWIGRRERMREREREREREIETLTLNMEETKSFEVIHSVHLWWRGWGQLNTVMSIDAEWHKWINRAQSESIQLPRHSRVRWQG